MKLSQKIRISPLFYLIIILFICSCKGEYCEGFNLKRIPHNLKYYQEPLQYSNGVDTITLYGTTSKLSAESELSGWANPTCDPNLFISYDGKPNIIHMLFSFEYSPENNYTELSISVNAGFSKPIKIDSAFRVNLKNNTKLVYQDIDNYGPDTTQMLRRFSMQNMRVTDFEFLNGIKWHLIHVGKSLKNNKLKSQTGAVLQIKARKIPKNK